MKLMNRSQLLSIIKDNLLSPDRHFAHPDEVLVNSQHPGFAFVLHEHAPVLEMFIDLF